ncbi:hypothetical protein RM844_20175 [Streptomyces sp. DSM 44915]|uniref:MFS transporter n=1 Tax=Streptomyces chisholmiae TaxID=3075540 RepID=A0ABU2JUF4_9ACTN|nr:hypothetical protein [Streptomyces sp. DSM 44915]
MSTPVVWLLGDQDAGALVGASLQSATGVAALAWAVLSAPRGPSGADAADEAHRTGAAEARDGGRAQSGVRRPRGRGGRRARAVRTGSATATGPDSVANSGIEPG